MSNNAAVTIDGGEIGRAQALQARAAMTDPHSDLNPVLLKPESEIGASVVLQGKRLGTVKASAYPKLKPQLLTAVTESFARLKKASDLVIVEGAGSPAEINLRDGDIANMGFAEACDVPVLLAGDIDRGGVIAQIVGTQAVLNAADGSRIKGFIINKFRGDPKLFEPGLDQIVQRTGWHALGVIPWFEGANALPAEDMMDIRSSGDGPIKVVVPQLSRIANFDDLDPLAQDPSVRLEIIKPGRPLPGDSDLVLIPGTKSTIADLTFFRSQGWDIDLAAHIRRGGRVLGICGGYQMLGKAINDPHGIEGPPRSVPGLGHLDVVTEMHPEKHLANVKAEFTPKGIPLDGYEIHIGKTSGPDCARSWLRIGARNDSAQSFDSRVRGCYLHGLFSSGAFRAAYFAEMGETVSGLDYEPTVEAALDALAGHLEQHLDLDLILRLAR